MNEERARDSADHADCNSVTGNGTAILQRSDCVSDKKKFKSPFLKSLQFETLTCPALTGFIDKCNNNQLNSCCCNPIPNLNTNDLLENDMKIKFATAAFAALCWLPIAGCSSDSGPAPVETNDVVNTDTNPGGSGTTTEAPKPSQGSGSSN